MNQVKLRKICIYDIKELDDELTFVMLTFIVFVKILILVFF